MSPRQQLTGRHIMLDGETFGTGNGAVFLQLAALEFWPSEPTRPSERGWHAYISLDSSLRIGRTVDPGALMFWLDDEKGAGPEARGALVAGMKTAIDWRDALEGLRQYCTGPSGRGMGHRPEPLTGVWSHGLTFDVAMLEQAYRDARMDRPWDFRSPLDTRTVFRLCGRSLSELVPPSGTKHNALDDCAQQVEAVHAALALLSNDKEV